MILDHLTAPNGDEVAIAVLAGKILQVIPAGIRNSRSGSRHFSMENMLVFPGLINSHDHLDFNNFPQLGTETYTNYTHWGKHIHRAYKEEIAKVLKIPAPLRAEWGLYKNLLCGVTSVVHHGEPVKPAFSPVGTIRGLHNLHSVAFEPRWKWRLNHPGKHHLPVVIHCGEGTDERSSTEIDRLLKWNLFGRPLIGVHGVAMTVRQASSFSALVWCPMANRVLLGATAPIQQLKQHTDILFGTDSTLTGDWNLWNHVQLARETRQLSDEELFRSLTSTPADTWKLDAGRLTPGTSADLFLTTKQPGKTPLETFCSLDAGDIQLVIQQGKIRLIDYELAGRFPDLVDRRPFTLVQLGTRRKYLAGDVSSLITSIRHYWPKASFPISTGSYRCSPLPDAFA